MKFNKQLYPHIDFSDIEGDKDAMEYRVSAYEEIVEPDRLEFVPRPKSSKLSGVNYESMAADLGWGSGGALTRTARKRTEAKKWLREYRKKNRPKFLKMTSDSAYLVKLLSAPQENITIAQLVQQKKPKPKPKPKKQRKKPVPKSVQEFGNALEYPFLYAQLIQVTVSIYKAHVRRIAAGKLKPPRHPRTLLRQAYDTAKNRLSVEEKYLTEEGFPTNAGIKRGMELIRKDANLGLRWFDEKKKKHITDPQRGPLERKSFLAPMIYGVALGDYVDCNFERAKEQYAAKHKKGSKNTSHSCPISRTQLKRELDIIRQAMDEVFRCDTAFGDCDNNSMSSGHCMLSALILQDLYGGKIKGGTIGAVPHYWNKFCHFEVDLTGDQFKKPKIQVKKGQLYKDSYEFKRDPFESLNQDFNQKVWNKHCRFRKRLIKELKASHPHLANKLAQATAQLRS